MALYFVGTTDAAMNDRLNCYSGSAWPDTSLYLGLLISGATDSSGTGAVELTHADYARKAISYGPAASRKISATADITFTSSATSAWNNGQNFKFFGLWNAATGGALRYIGVLTTQFAVVTGSVVIVPAATATIYSTPIQVEVA